MMTTHTTRALSLAAGLICSLAGTVHAGAPGPDPAVRGIRVLLSDRDTDTIWMLWDENNDGVIQNTEVARYFSPLNAAGTSPAGNPTAMGMRRDGMLIIGDQAANRVIRVWDRNFNYSGEDAAESSVFATTPSPWPHFGFVVGAAFDSAGEIYVVNAGNAAFPVDGIFRLRDLNRDNDANDNVGGVDEAQAYCNAPPLGPGNTAYSPQEIIFFKNVGYMRESATTFQGVWTFRDNNANGNCNDAGEFTAFLTAGNASGVALSAGFAMEPDLARPGSGDPSIAPGPAMYTYQVATGAVDQIVRMQDLNGDGDANDAGEAAIVYSTNETGFSILDLLCLDDGSLLVVDNSGKKVYRLKDANNDGVFDASERTVFFDNAPQIISDMRKIVRVPIRCVCDIADDVGVPLLGGNARVNEGDYNCFFMFFFETVAGQHPCDIAKDDGTPFNGGNGNVNEGDYNCFFMFFFNECT